MQVPDLMMDSFTTVNWTRAVSDKCHLWKHLFTDKQTIIKINKSMKLHPTAV